MAQPLMQNPICRQAGRPSYGCELMAMFAVSLLGASLRSPKLRLVALGAASAGAILATLSVLRRAQGRVNR